MTWVNPTHHDGAFDLDRIIDLEAFTDISVVGRHDPPLPPPGSDAELAKQRATPFAYYDVIGYLPPVGYPKGGNEVILAARLNLDEARHILAGMRDHLNGGEQ